MIVKEKIDDLLYKVSRPERYIGNEWNQITKDWSKTQIKVLFSFPDVYEIGMSHLGIKLLYHKLNQEENILCERVFAPWTDLEKILRDQGIPLFSLESKHEVKDFDIFAFTLQYEMSYTNIINMLDLSGLSIYSKDRDLDAPLVIAGGSTVFNPEPLAPFIDLFFIGEAETEIVNLVQSYYKDSVKKLSKKQILKNLNKIPGVYVPSLYEICYDKNGGVKNFKKESSDIKDQVKRQIVSNLDQAFYPEKFIVPYMNIVHNRIVIEIARGCTRGCRFCEAGMTYRPVRERKPETIINLADKIIDNTGLDEISLSSLSTVDYSDIKNLVNKMANRYQDDKISIALPSLRIDDFSVELAHQVQKVRKSGLTMAPEAGTQRLRDVINKGVEEKDLYQAVRAAFKSGWYRVKLYFMIGLPTETETDLAGIVKMAKKVRKIGRKIKGKVEVNVSISTYVPKPFTPFQWVKMINKEEIIEKQSYLRDNIKGKGLELNWNDPEISLIEGVLARGDRRLASVLKSVWDYGAKFDSWDDKFDFNIWQKALKDNNLKLEQYLAARDLKSKLPWFHINLGIDENFLKNEYDKALKGEKTLDCRQGSCTGCNLCFDFDTEMELVRDDNDDT